MILPGGSAPGPRNGVCTSHGQSVFFYEFPSELAADHWLKSGGLEIGPTDAVYTAGPVVILATDAATSKDLAALFKPYTR